MTNCLIDDDLGCSGATTVGRHGFQRLVAEVGLDHVGMVLGLEMSRLSRSSRDWYQLLEVCAIFSTLIGDLDGIYDPSLYNDRLLLGLKGTLSEAELHSVKQRMIEGKRAKARRGELDMPVSMGYVRQLIERIVVTVVDSTEAVQVEVHWQGGHSTQTLVKRPMGRLEQMSDYQALIDRVKELQSQGCSIPKMAEILNAEGWVPPKQRGPYSAPMVPSLLNRQGINLGTPKQQHTADIPREADEWTVKELAQQLQMPEPTLYAWLKKGLIKARQVQANARLVWLITADADQLEHLRQQRSAQRIWIQQQSMDEIQ